MPSLSEKRAAFRRLHERGCFVLPNPWDVGSARYLQSVGFKAIASTSAGMAWSKGLADGQVTREVVLAHLAELAEAGDLPLNADFENGFAHDPAGVAESVRLAVEAGVSGLSIEDYSGEPQRGLYPLEDAVARIAAARAAIDKTGADVLLVGRAEGLLRGNPDLDEAIARLKAYADAGADCLYAPALRSTDDIARVVEALAPKPVNVLAGFVDLDVEGYAALGVRRVSLGGALAAAAWGGLMRAAGDLAANGTFAGFAGAAGGGEIVKALARPA